MSSFETCDICKSKYIAGQDCKVCDSDNLGTRMAKYAGAMKDAVSCWSRADCKEHMIPCQPALKEFANSLLDLRARIEMLEKAIIAHKEKNNNIQEYDIELYKNIIE